MSSQNGGGREEPFPVRLGANLLSSALQRLSGLARRAGLCLEGGIV